MSARQGQRPTGEPRRPAEVAGDRLEELVRLHSPYVARLALRLLGRDAEVDDVVQEVFLSLLRFHASVREADAIRGWLATTTARLCQRRMGSLAWRMRRWSSADDFESHEASAPGASADDRVALAQVHRALGGVSASARVAWILRYVEQERMEDVARIMGCSLTTAKRRVAIAQAAARRALDDG